MRGVLDLRNSGRFVSFFVQLVNLPAFVSSFGIIMWELITAADPFDEYAVAHSGFMSLLEDAIIDGLRCGAAICYLLLFWLLFVGARFIVAVVCCGCGCSSQLAPCGMGTGRAPTLPQYSDTQLFVCTRLIGLVDAPTAALIGPES